jgi:hypothetical protein
VLRPSPFLHMLNGPLRRNSDHPAISVSNDPFTKRRIPMIGQCF